MNTNSRHRQNILITMKYMELKVLITELTHQIDLDSWSPPYLPIVPVRWETICAVSMKSKNEWSQNEAVSSLCRNESKKFQLLESS